MPASIPNKKRRRGARSGSAASGGPVAPEASYIGRRDRRVRAGARTRGHLFPRRKPSIVARRVTLGVLIAMSMALITVSYRGGAVLHSSQLVVMDAVAPIERGISRAWDPVAAAWGWSGRLITATNENPKLERENVELKAKLRQASIAQDEYERQLDEANFDARATFPAGFTRVWASVQVRQPGAIEHSIVIDRGSNDGIERYDPVMAVSGLIGRVENVTANTAVVSLMIDDSQRVSASVVDSDAWGVLRTVSTEGSPTMQLKFVSQSAKVDVDDLVTTSGFSSKNGELRSIYPKGLPIGVVTSVGNDPADLHKTVQVTPLADFDRIDDVMVLVKQDGATR